MERARHSTPGHPTLPPAQVLACLPIPPQPYTPKRLVRSFLQTLPSSPPLASSSRPHLEVRLELATNRRRPLDTAAQHA